MKEDAAEDRFSESLSDRELEILTELQRGASDRQIAQKLHLSVNTIKWHNRQIYSKLGVSGREEAAQVADARALLVEEDDETERRQKGPPHNLPAIDPANFIGRQSEIEQIQSFLGRKRLVTLTGPGGVGKTRLALQVAARSLEAFTHGVHLVELASIDAPEMFMSQLAKTLGIVERAGQDLNERLSEFLSGRRVLLVLDNFEHLLAAAAALGDLLVAAPQFRVLATSRQRLGLYGEQIVPIEPLGVAEAVDLFYQRARSFEPEFDPEREQESTVRQICRLVDQLPLAVELAAGRIQLLPPLAMADRLATAFDSLVSGERDRPDRHQTLQATLDWSYQLLTEQEKQLFATLGGFAAGTQLDALEAVCDPALSSSLLDLVQALMAKSLIRRQPGVAGEPQIGMLSTIRAYAREKIADKASFHKRLADFYLSFTEQTTAMLRGPQKPAGRFRQRLEQELPNLRLAFENRLAADEVEAALNLFINLRYFFWATDPSQGLHWAGKALEHGPEASERIHAQALTVAAELHYMAGALTRSGKLGRQALDMLKMYGGDIARADALRMLGSVENQLGNFDEAEEILKEALALYEELGSRYDVSYIHNSLGEMRRMQGQYDRAKESYEKSLRIRSESFSGPGAAAILLNLAAIARHLQATDESLSYVLDALITSQERQILPMICGALEQLAGLVYERDPARSARWMGAAAATREDIGHAIEPVDRPLYDQDVAGLRQHLGEVEFKQAWDEGRQLQLDQVVSQAMEVASDLAHVDLEG